MAHHIALVLAVMRVLLSAPDLRSQTASTAQSATGAISKADRERALGMLEAVSKSIQDLYYDPKMNGLD
ncbi:MAG: hypothetical protein WB762_09175 [Candidatus Sulfotelmatobacter sp.]